MIISTGFEVDDIGICKVESQAWEIIDTTGHKYHKLFDE